ncbi:MAG: hypothetical protein HY553_19120 [Elusimicrobia bacterium]|nr:hypothetical protein [Elusimicrobiota bacterium]
MKGQPVLVASGAIRIDRQAALQKLKDYQAADPWTCLLEFARSAHAAEASRVDVELVRRRALRIRFDGRAFGWSRLLDPFEALLRPGATDAGRHLAVGLLGALRVSKRVIVTSGRPPFRWKTRIRSLFELRLVRAQGRGTFIDLFDVSPPRGWEKPLLESCRMARPLVVVAGVAAAQGVGSGAPGLDFETPRRRGRVERIPFRGVPALELYTRGVLAEVLSLGSGSPVRAWVDDDGLNLDASRAKVARNRRFRGVLNTIREQSRGFSS